jgi:hypothetical protein
MNSGADAEREAQEAVEVDDGDAGGAGEPELGRDAGDEEPEVMVVEQQNAGEGVAGEEEEEEEEEEEDWGFHHGRRFDKRFFTAPGPSRTSVYWQYFVLSNTEDGKVKCLLCSEVKTGTNTNCLAKHMDSRHKTEYAALEAAKEGAGPSDEKRGGAAAGVRCPTCGERPDAVAFKDERVRELNRYLAAYIARHCR